ncbi:hypothetical protein LIER_33209 [Lithospermum erythrorhizon]|uniref:Uncharacterized protein n=1 Tax=Lithospermum erythrorhizon TaxID=34254 RepID=A0AAV3S1P7_LITER
MNSSRNDDHPQRNNALNLNNPAAGWNEDAPPNIQEPINIVSRRTPPEERLLQLRADAPAISSSIREETYTHTPPNEVE